MPLDVGPIAHGVARAIELIGIGVIVFGGTLATLGFAGQAMKRHGDFSTVYRWYRTQLGRAILLGLEFLVAGDIIGTMVVEPTFESLGVLGLIVLIRTFLSFSLEVEINGRWPWQSGGAEGGGAPGNI